MPNSVQFSHLYHILRHQLRNEIYVNIDKTHKKFITNCGELPQFGNKVASNPWSVIIPGYRPLTPYKKYRVKELLGVYTTPSGNHRLIIDVHTGVRRDVSTIHRDVERFQKKYENHTNLQGSVLYFI